MHHAKQTICRRAIWILVILPCNGMQNIQYPSAHSETVTLTLQYITNKNIEKLAQVLSQNPHLLYAQCPTTKATILHFAVSKSKHAKHSINKHKFDLSVDNEDVIEYLLLQGADPQPGKHTLHPARKI